MIFVDTGFFYATMVPHDQWFPLTERIYQERTTLITSSFVVNETVTLLQRRGFLSRALEFLAEIQTDPSVQIVYPDQALQSRAWDEFKVSGTFGANAVDCMSFVIMRKLGIKRAYTFDRAHFQAAGFEPIP